MELNVVATLHQSRLHSNFVRAGSKAGLRAPCNSRDAPILRNARSAATCATVQLDLPLGDVVSVLIAAGLRLEWLHEHDSVP